MAAQRDNSVSVLTSYTVDSWNPPSAYGDGAPDMAMDQTDEKARKKQYTAADMNVLWSATTLLSKTQLPFPSGDQAQRLASAEAFRLNRRHRCTVTAKLPPPVATFVVADEEACDSVDCATLNADATLCAASYDSKTVVWCLPVNNSKHSNGEEMSASKLYTSLFLPHGKQRFELPTGRGTSCVDFSPDAPVLLTGSTRGQVGLWSIEAAQKLVSYSGLTSRTPVWDLEWCPAGAYFATGSGDSCARVWRSDIPFPVRVLPVGDDSSHCHLVKWHPSCQLLAAASAQQITVFEVSGPASLFKFEFKQATAMEFSPTGYLLAAANADTLTVWDTNTGSVLFRFDTFSRIVSLAWSHPSSSGLGDGGLKSVLQQSGTGHPVLISIDESGKLRLWDRLFVNKASVSELSFGQAPRPLHMHITPRNLLVMVGAKQSSDLSTLDCIRTLGSADA